ncbi:MAG: hypothetical protein K0V04_34360 [Deltaproteobacteria bacterium]|nr:hypothetical protein [Deltaproteobacteria bacterium]
MRPRWCRLGLTLAVVGSLPPAVASAGEIQGDVLPAACTSSYSPDEVVPVLATPVHVGDTSVRLHAQQSGETIEVWSNTRGLLLGPGPTKDGSRFDLPSPLVAGESLSICQTNPWLVCSLLQPVETPPATLGAPAFPHVVFAHGSAVTVSGVHPGATVEVSVGGVVIGQRWAGTRTSADVPIDDTLPAGTILVAQQIVGGLASPTASTVIFPGNPAPVVPRVRGPVRTDDLAVWVSGITPGSLVEVIDTGTGTVLGSKHVGEPVAKIATCPIGTDPIRVDVTRNGVTLSSADEALAAYSGAQALRLEGDFDWGTDPGTGLPIQGRYYKSDSWVDTPAVFVIHGQDWGQCDLDGDLFENHDSEQGYGYVLEELNAWSIRGYSIKVDDSFESVEVRTELLLATIDEAIARGEIDADTPIALMGHSLGGDAVIYARSIASAGLDIRGVVSIAPTSYAARGDFVDFDPSTGPQAPLLEIYGSEDTFSCSGFDSQCSVWNYDQAWFAKSIVHIAGAGHYSLSECWAQTNPDGSLSPTEQREIAGSFIVPFLYDRLNSDTRFLPYFQGSVRPRGTYRYDIAVQHHWPWSTSVIDSFGDSPDELSFPDDNVDPLVNARGLAVTESFAPLGGGVEEHTHADLEVNLGVTYEAMHDPDHHAAVLTWDDRRYVYRSDLGGVSATADDFISLRVMAVAGDSATELNGETGVPIDFMVGLGDGVRSSNVRVGSTGSVLYPFDDHGGDPSQVMRTVRVPLDAFIALTPNLDLSNLQLLRVRARVRNEGRIIIDDLEIGP